MGTPQIIWITLTALGIGVAFAKHGERTTYDFWASGISAAVAVYLLHWGGFFG